MSNKVYTISELSEKTGKHKNTIKKHIKEGFLTAFKEKRKGLLTFLIKDEEARKKYTFLDSNNEKHNGDDIDNMSIQGDDTLYKQIITEKENYIAFLKDALAEKDKQLNTDRAIIKEKDRLINQLQEKLTTTHEKVGIASGRVDILKEQLVISQKQHDEAKRLLVQPKDSKKGFLSKFF